MSGNGRIKDFLAVIALAITMEYLKSQSLFSRAAVSKENNDKIGRAIVSSRFDSVLAADKERIGQ
jgi:hypothetical protein